MIIGVIWIGFFKNFNMQTTIVFAMSDTNQQFIDFWYDFDNFFLFRASDSIKEALRKVGPYQQLVDLFYHLSSKGTISTEYKKELENLGVKEAIKLLAENQTRIIDEHFKGNTEIERTAFELFSQGLLFDNGIDVNGLPRRPLWGKVHMMDSSVTGFVVWHAFVRAAAVLELFENTDRLLQLDREIALAAAILSACIADGKGPEQTANPGSNQPLDNSIVSQLRDFWLNQSFDQIDSKITNLEKSTITQHI
jgi:hypothetical protein